MGLFSSLFGPSKLSEEFSKAASLQWGLRISNIRKSRHFKYDNDITNQFESSSVYFDFKNKVFRTFGEVSKKGLFGASKYWITSMNISKNEPEIFLASAFTPESTTVKCSVYGDGLHFSALYSNWKILLINTDWSIKSNITTIEDFKFMQQIIPANSSSEESEIKQYLINEPVLQAIINTGDQNKIQEFLRNHPEKREIILKMMLAEANSKNDGDYYDEDTPF